MNNMKYYNDSLAYDFEMFAAKPAKKTAERNNVVPLPSRQERARRSRAANAIAPSVMAVLVMVVVLAGLCGNISLRLKINEVNAKITGVKQEINEMKSEKTALEMEVQRRVSYANLELEATQLGMRKMEKENVKYIRVNNNNTATTVDGKFDTAEE